MREICIFEKTNNLEEDKQNILNYAIEFFERENVIFFWIKYITKIIKYLTKIKKYIIIKL